MPDWMLSFDRPWYLALMVLVPLLVGLGLRSLTGMGRLRRTAALSLRAAVITLIVMALAEASWVRTSDRMTVVYLLDRSLSIPEQHRRRMLEYVNRSVARHWRADRQDRVGVIVFGRDAAVEIPPVDDRIEAGPRIESLFDPQQSDLAAALQMALALMPQDSARRVVLVSDGNENLGDARQAAQAIVERGIGIDAVPVEIPARRDVALERLTLPPDIRRGEPFELRVVLRTDAGRTDARQVQDITGRLTVVRKAGEAEVILADETIQAGASKQVLSLRDQIDASNFYTYEARFVADDASNDAVPQNNVATAFTHVRGQGAVLLIEDWVERGEFDHLVERLRRENLEVDVIGSNQVSANLADLQRYDTIILANVPRSSGEDADTITHFSDEQVRMLVRNTQQMGSGLLLLGGPNSFGAGGWTNTELERAMPVDFEIKDAEVVPVGALVLLMHASELPEGNHWQKVVARESIRTLGSQDYCGLIHFDGSDRWLWNHPQGGMLKVGIHRRAMLSALDRMTPGDMPQFDPSMVMAASSLAALTDAAVRHMIIISDGDPSPPTQATLASLKAQGVRVTTVAIGAHGPPGSTPLQNIANFTGGKYYVVNNARALPRIYQREVRRISRPLVYEDRQGMTPQIVSDHEMIKGLDGPLPPITGFVLTTVKDNPLVEVPLVSPKPAGLRTSTLLAGWTYGVGKTAVLTTDAGRRWATSWTEWPQYDKLFSQIVRWSMRPAGETGAMSLATQVQDGTAHVVVTVQDELEGKTGLGNVFGSVVGPDLQPLPLSLTQTAVGRYEGSFDARAAGSYFVMVQPGAEMAPLRAGVNVGYSDEFRNLETNRPLLESVASLRPPEGPAGKLAAPLAADPDLEALLAVDPFRRDLAPATSRRAIWPPCVLIGAAVFFGDVLIRRVSLDLSWLALAAARLWRYLRFGNRQTDTSDSLGRLHERKAEVAADIARKKASAAMLSQQGPRPATDARSERSAPTAGRPTGTAAGHPAASETVIGASGGEEKSPLEPEVPEAPSYTERLLAAKRKVWEKRDPN